MIKHLSLWALQAWNLGWCAWSIVNNQWWLAGLMALCFAITCGTLWYACDCTRMEVEFKAEMAKLDKEYQQMFERMRDDTL